MIDLLSSYQIERHIRRERDEGPNRLKKEVTLSPEFQALWDRIKPKTTYRVEFETDESGPTVPWMRSSGWRRSRRRKIRVSAGQIGVSKGGVAATAVECRRGAGDIWQPGPCPICWPTCRTRPS